MVEKTFRVVLLLIIAGIISLCMYPSLRNFKRGFVLKPQQEKLATRLEVKIQDYPYEHDFPAGYFNAILKPGMTLSDVHALVKGYKEVYQCFGWGELYYYFSGDEEKAVVFLLTYDNAGKFVDLRGGDPFGDSFGVWPGCSMGLLGE